MSNYLNSDGSGLVGGLNPSNVGQAFKVDSNGNLKTTGNVSPAASTGTLSNVAAAAVSTKILDVNTNRASAYVYNDSASALYLAYDTSASTSHFTFKVPANALWEMPNLYTGAIYGIWDQAVGAARVTEVQ